MSRANIRSKKSASSHSLTWWRCLMSQLTNPLLKASFSSGGHRWAKHSSLKRQKKIAWHRIRKRWRLEPPAPAHLSLSLEDTFGTFCNHTICTLVQYFGKFRGIPYKVLVELCRHISPLMKNPGRFRMIPWKLSRPSSGHSIWMRTSVRRSSGHCQTGRVFRCLR